MSRKLQARGDRPRAPKMNLTFAALEAEYSKDLGSMTLTATHAAALAARRLLAHRDRFVAVQQRCGVPALWLMPVFERENPSFNSYLGNGDPLDRPTVHVPRGRGPFACWEDGAADALALDHVRGDAAWTWPFAAYEWERWNGFGPRMHGRPSGYPWAGTSIYRGGKYVADGVWSPGTWDHQLGCVAIAKAIAALDAEIAHGFSM